jgi:pimeloyl-ACP methyl ester carboxylesterase
MRWYRASQGRLLGLILAGAVLMPWPHPECRGDRVIMKNGLVYVSQGTPDKDNSLIYIWDGLKRVIVRDSKIEKMVPGNDYRTGEKFQLIQPIVVHAGSMPKEVLSVDAGPWDERGRRTFRYLGSRVNRSLSMEQAIIEIGPHIVRYRGIDGFWVGVVETSQIPHPVIMSLVGRVDQKNGEERERVVRFLMDAGWYTEAREELDRIIQDFPKTELGQRAAGARVFIVQAEATQRRSELDMRRKAQQYLAVSRLLKTFHEKDISVELQVDIREIQRHDLQQQAADKALAVDLRRLAGRLTPAARAPWQKAMVEVLKAIDEAPDAVRDRFVAWQKAKDDPKSTDEARFALAMSGYIVGQDMAVSNLKEAEALWQARDAARGYLTAAEPAQRSEQAARLESVALPSAAPATPDPIHRLELLTRIVQLMPPPRHDPAEPIDKTTLHRVLEDENAEPTEYAVRLPPEYHPLRNYPALVVLHSGPGPAAAIDEWSDEAARHGYILIAPEYNLPGQPHDYRYTTSEHAAVELALRDARKRYAIDSDRVFVAGQLTGGNMAWDYSLAHPDLFAGVVVFSGLPAKYVPKYSPHHERLPLYCVLGELAPAAGEVVYNNLLKPMIGLKAWDVTYVEYQRRGLETFPEEVPRAFDWMDRHRRDPFPKAFKVFAARPSDNRFYGVVVHDYATGHTTAPEAVELFGQNLNPAEIKMSSSGLSNQIRLEIKGVRSLDLWLSPKLIDFKRKPEILLNRRPYARGRKGPLKLDPETMLDDLRLRGDRQQLYWHRISID